MPRGREDSACAQGFRRFWDSRRAEVAVNKELRDNGQLRSNPNSAEP